ncbi:MAG: DUF6159 family protein [Gammaproteobacteria bacterium]|nr:DUF6159 family protein [Gammaproteobacteria bacterium]
MFDRLGRSWELVKFSADILRKDKELLVFPLLSSIAGLLVMASFFPLLLIPGSIAIAEQGQQLTNQIDMAALFLLYLIEYFVIFFFNAALVAAALERINGGDPTVASGFQAVLPKIGIIFFYSIIAATVGVVLRSIGERGGIFGRIISGLTGVFWTLASFLAVPVLVSRNVGPVDALRESFALMKRTWGENVIANAGLGVVFFLVYLVVLLSMFGLISIAASYGTETMITLVIIFGLLLMILGLMQAALQGIFSAALYHYAVDGEDDAGIPAEVLGGAFSPKS